MSRSYNSLVGYLLLLLTTCAMQSESAQHNPIYFCTAADSRYYWQALNLIGSIQKLHFKELGEIAVYNLGLTDEQRSTLNRIQKVKVYEVEKTNPDIITPFVTDSGGRRVPDGLHGSRSLSNKA